MNVRQRSNKYLLDTNVFIWLDRYKRGKQVPTDFITVLQPLLNQSVVELYVSMVTIAELLVFVEKNNWSSKRRNVLAELISDINIISLQDDLVREYVIVDLYSLGLEVWYNEIGYQLVGSDVVMKKNDLWIASTALKYDCTLITTDSDFNHLSGLIGVVHLT
jgi:predicted nucleic acid-binding protein